MEFQEKVRGVVIEQVHLLGGSLIRLGEGLQSLAQKNGTEGAPRVAERPAKRRKAAPRKQKRVRRT
jgi:hypothetical protein